MTRAKPQQGENAKEETPRLEFELIGGHEDRAGKVHKRVVFGRRLLGRDLFMIETSPAASVQTQHNLLIIRQCIVEFGEMELFKGGHFEPVPLTTLLALDSIDVDDLNAKYNEYLSFLSGDREAKILNFEEFQFARGLEVSGRFYDLITFGLRTTGNDDVLADKMQLRLPSLKRECFMIGRQISELRSTTDPTTARGPVDMSAWETADANDIYAVRPAAELWRQTFRLSRGVLSELRDGAKRLAARDENRLERGADSSTPARTP